MSHPYMGGYGVDLTGKSNVRPISNHRHLVNIEFMNGRILCEVEVLSEHATDFGVMSGILDKKRFTHNGTVYPTINIFSIDYVGLI